MKPESQDRNVLQQIERLQTELEELKDRLAWDEGGAPSEAATAIDKVVKTVIKARRKRDHYFEDGLFAEPAWDMLLELYSAELSQRRISVGSLCYAAAVPGTTALRWIEKLHQLGWIQRDSDPLDGRRVFVFLSPKGKESMQRYFEAVVPQITAL